MGCIGCPETSVNNYQHTLRNIPEERSPQLRRDGSLDSRKYKYRCFLRCSKSSENSEFRNLYQDCTSKYGSIQFTKYVIDNFFILTVHFNILYA